MITLGVVGIGHMCFVCGMDMDSGEPRVDCSGLNGGPPKKINLDPDFWNLC